MSNIENIIKQIYREWMTKSEILDILRTNYQDFLSRLLSIDKQNLSKEMMVKYELFRLFDIDDKELIVDNIPKMSTRGECHTRLESGIESYHRGILWIITNSKGDILLSQRAKDKDLFPLYWEIWWGHCGLDSYVDALEDELEDELGIKFSEYKLKSLFKIQFEDEAEKQTAKVFQIEVKDDFVPNGKDGEVQESKFFTVEEIKKLLETQTIDLLPDNIVVLNRFLWIEQELEDNIRFL